MRDAGVAFALDYRAAGGRVTHVEARSSHAFIALFDPAKFSLALDAWAGLVMASHSTDSGLIA